MNEEESKLIVWWNKYKTNRAIRKSQNKRFWFGFFEELGLKKAKVEKAYVYVTPEERGKRSALRFKKIIFFVRDFIVYCCKKIYSFFKWFVNVLMDAGEHLAKQNKKQEKVKK